MSRAEASTSSACNAAMSLRSCCTWATWDCSSASKAAICCWYTVSAALCFCRSSSNSLSLASTESCSKASLSWQAASSPLSATIDAATAASSSSKERASAVRCCVSLATNSLSAAAFCFSASSIFRILSASSWLIFSCAVTCACKTRISASFEDIWDA